MRSNLTSDNIQLSQPIIESEIGGFDRRGDVDCLQSIASALVPSATVGQYLSAAIADNTRRAYQADLADFYRWGGIVPCSPELLAEYVSFRAATHCAVTLTRRVVAISRAHTTRNFPDPAKNDLVRTVLRGVRRLNGNAQRQVRPLLKEDVMAMLPQMRGTKGLRDKALLLIGFAAALRRSELVALDLGDIAFVSEGLVLTIRRSKTDQEGVGRRIAIPHGRTSGCPVKALRAWLEQAAIAEGAIFRSVNKGGGVGGRLSANAVAEIVKTHADSIGLSPHEFSGHSLRSGLVTSAVLAGISTHKIMAQTGHRSSEMVARYIRDADIFNNNAGGIL